MNLSRLAVKFWDMMHKKYGSHRVDKASALEMKAVAAFLELAGIQDKDEFMTRYTTTIGHTIYVPYEVGVGNERQLWRQITTCVHEHEHIVQLERDGDFLFRAQYALDSSMRARYEAEAYRCNLEMHWWRYGELRDVEKEAAKLEHYGCSADEIKFVELFLRMSGATIKKGGAIGTATKVALRWLERHAPELKAKTS